MIRRPASLELFIPSATTTKSVNGVLYLAGMPPITVDNVVSCNLLCPSTGTAQVVTVCPVIAEGCDCPFTWDLQINKLPDLLTYGTDNTFVRPHFYTYVAPNAATPTKNAVSVAVASYINADPNSPVTATVDGSDCLVLTGNVTGSLWAAYAPSATIALTTPGVPDQLTADQLKRMFPIQPGVFGQKPFAVTDLWCGCKCLLKVKVQFCCESDLPSDAADISMDRALLGHQYEFIIAIPCDYKETAGVSSNDPKDWEEPYKTLSNYFACLVPAS